MLSRLATCLFNRYKRYKHLFKYCYNIFLISLGQQLTNKTHQIQFNAIEFGVLWLLLASLLSLSGLGLSFGCGLQAGLPANAPQTKEKTKPSKPLNLTFFIFSLINNNGMEANQLHFLRLICEGNERVDLAGMKPRKNNETHLIQLHLFCFQRCKRD